MENLGITLFENFYQGKNVLITGNTGFKGSWLSIWLRLLGANVYGFSDKIPTTPSLYESAGLGSFVKQFWGDIRDEKAVETVISEIKPDFIFHLAAQALVKESYINPLETLMTNSIGTANVLEALRKFAIPTVAIIVTSDKCYDNKEQLWGYKETDALGGKDIYSASKAMAEHVFEAYHHSFFKDKTPVSTASVRGGNVIGGGDWANDRIIPDCIKAWSEGKKVAIRRPNATRPWQFVLEPLGGYLLLGYELYHDFRLKGHSFNFGPHSNQNFTVHDVIKRISTYWTLNNAQSLVTINEDSAFHEATFLKVNIELAQRFLGWEPVLNFEETIELTGNWYNYFYLKNPKPKSLYAYCVKQIEQYLDKARRKNIQWVL